MLLWVQKANSARFENVGYEVSMGELFFDPRSAFGIICELVLISLSRGRAFVTATQGTPPGFQLEGITMPTPISSDFCQAKFEGLCR